MSHGTTVKANAASIDNPPKLDIACLYCGRSTYLPPVPVEVRRVRVTLFGHNKQRGGFICLRCNERDAPPHSDWLRHYVKMDITKDIADLVACFLSEMFDLYAQASLPNTILETEVTQYKGLRTQGTKRALPGM